jgi:hypothetical protein
MLALVSALVTWCSHFVGSVPHRRVGASTRSTQLILHEILETASRAYRRAGGNPESVWKHLEAGETATLSLASSSTHPNGSYNLQCVG